MVIKNMSNQILNNAENVLKQLDADPETQECLRLYQKIPESEKRTFNLILDAFIRGMGAGMELSRNDSYVK